MLGPMSRRNPACTGNSIDVCVGASRQSEIYDDTVGAGGFVVGAMLVPPESVGIDMRERAERGVSLGRQAMVSGLSEASSPLSRIRRLLSRI